MACKRVAYLVLLLLISSVASDRPEIKEEDPESKQHSSDDSTKFSEIVSKKNDKPNEDNKDDHTASKSTKNNKFVTKLKDIAQPIKTVYNSVKNKVGSPMKFFHKKNKKTPGVETSEQTGTTSEQPETPDNKQIVEVSEKPDSNNVADVQPETPDNKQIVEVSDQPDSNNVADVAIPDDKTFVKLMTCRPDVRKEETEYNRAAKVVFDAVMMSNTTSHQFFQQYTLLKNTVGTFVLLEVFADETASKKHSKHHNELLLKYQRARGKASCKYGLTLRKEAGSEVLSVTREKEISHLRYAPENLDTLKNFLNTFGDETWILFADDHAPGHYELFIPTEKKDTFKDQLTQFNLQDDKNVDEDLVAFET